MTLFEVFDVATALGLTPASVRRLADEGKLVIAALTPRGQRLFDPSAVERLRQQREARKPAA